MLFLLYDLTLKEKEWLVQNVLSILGTVFDEILTSIYLEIAFILGLQTLQSIDLSRMYFFKGSGAQK